MEFDQTLQALGSEPIPGDSATGQAARYEPEFEQMQAEIDKLAALDVGAPDWTLINQCATTLLAKKSKDILVSVYLCASLWEMRSWSGLADGLNVVKVLVNSHWEALHPERLRARKTAVDWLLDRLKPLAEVAAVQPTDKEALSACISLLDELVAFGETRWEGDPPTLWSLTKILQSKMSGLPAESATTAVEVVSDGESPKNAARPPAGNTFMPLPSGQAMIDRSAIYQQIITLAEHLIAMEPHSPVPYLLRRAASWGPMPLPQLYGELQRSGSMWDLVLQQLPGATSAASAATPIYVAPEENASPQPRGDY